MKRIKRASVVLIAVALVVSLTMVLPASAQNGRENVDVLNSEFVVCTLDSAGEIEEVQVFNQLSLDGDGKVTVKQEKAFEEVGSFQGVKGFATPSVEGDYIVWPEISVNGPANVLASTKLSEPMVEEARTRIPLKTEYTYWFDGERVTDLETITGKSGSFAVELKLTNTSKEMTAVEYRDPTTGAMVTEQVEVYMPLVILPYDWYFDNQVFFNLEADPTGSIVPMPDFYNVGWSIPLFPPATEESHTIWVKADVKNFQMPPLTLAVLFHFPETNQNDVTATFAPYIKIFYDGLKQVNAGIGSANTGDTLLFGVNAVYDGMQQLAAGLPDAKAALDTQLIPGAQAAAAGIGSATTPDTLLYADSAAIAGLQGISAGIGSTTSENTLLYAAYLIMNGLSSDDPANPGLLQGLQLMSTVLTAIADSLVAAQGDLQSGVVYELTEYGAANDTIRGLVGISPTMAVPEKEALLDLMDSVAADVNTVIAGIAGNVGILQYIINELTKADGAIPGVEQMHAGMEAIYGGLSSIQAGIGTTTTEDTLLYALGAIEGGLAQIKAGLSSGNMDDPGIAEGLMQISEGIGEAVAGLGSAGTPDTLLYGANAINEGLTELSGGTGALEEGLATMLNTISLTNAELEAIAERGEEFDHFLGRAQDAENHVSFVYQTKPTYNYKTGNSTSWIVAIVLSLIIALGLVAGGILLARRSSA